MGKQAVFTLQYLTSGETADSGGKGKKDAQPQMFAKLFKQIHIINSFFSVGRLY